MNRTWQITARVDLAVAAGLILPAGLKADLLKERNRIVHAGQSPTNPRRSFALANDVVQSLVPLSLTADGPLLVPLVAPGTEPDAR